MVPLHVSIGVIILKMINFMVILMMYYLLWLWAIRGETWQKLWFWLMVGFGFGFIIPLQFVR